MFPIWPSLERNNWWHYSGCLPEEKAERFMTPSMFRAPPTTPRKRRPAWGAAAGHHLEDREQRLEEVRQPGAGQRNGALARRSGAEERAPERGCACACARARVRVRVCVFVCVRACARRSKCIVRTGPTI